MLQKRKEKLEKFCFFHLLWGEWCWEFERHLGLLFCVRKGLGWYFSQPPHSSRCHMVSIQWSQHVNVPCSEVLHSDGQYIPCIKQDILIAIRRNPTKYSMGLTGTPLLMAGKNTRLAHRCETWTEGNLALGSGAEDTQPGYATAPHLFARICFYVLLTECVCAPELHTLKTSYSGVAAFRDKASEEVIKVKWGQ